MDDDFEGALEDVQQDEQQSGGSPCGSAALYFLLPLLSCCSNSMLCCLVASVPIGRPAGGESGDEEEGEERVDQQMGEAGPEGEDVDERLWNEEDKEQEQQGQVRCGRRQWRCCRSQQGKVALVHVGSRRCQEALAPAHYQYACECVPLIASHLLQEQEGADDRSLQVGDKSQLDYAAGGEEDEEQAQEDEGKEGQQPQAQEGGAEEEQPQPQAGVEEEQEEEEAGDYQDRCGHGRRALGSRELLSSRQCR